MLTPVPPDRDAPGAIGPLLAAQLDGLSARNEVTVVCVAGPDPAELESARRLKAAGFDVHPVLRVNAGGAAAWGRRARYAYGWLALRRPWRTVWYADAGIPDTVGVLLAKRCFDVLAAEDDAMGVFDFDRRVPSVLTVHELGQAPPARSSGPLAPARDLLADLNSRRRPRYQREVCRRFRLLVVYTEADRARLAGLDPSLESRVRVSPFGIELPAVPDGDLEEPDTLLFAGNYWHSPNVEAAIWLAREILPRVRSLRPAARLRLIGVAAPSAVSELAELPGVDFLGRVERLGPHLARAAVVLAPVRSGGGMRMKVLHAMACGRAVVTTPLGAEGLTDGGPPPLVIGRNAQELAASTAALLADDAARRALAREARAFVEERHGPDAVARRLERVYAEASALSDDAPPARR